MHRHLLLTMGAMLGLSSVVAFAEPVTGSYKLIDETITDHPGSACSSIVNSGIYFGDMEKGPIVFKYNQMTHTLTIGSDVPTNIILTPTGAGASAGKAEINFNRPDLKGRITIDVNSSATGNTFEVAAVSQMASGAYSQTCFNIALFGLSDSDPNAG